MYWLASGNSPTKFVLNAAPSCSAAAMGTTVRNFSPVAMTAIWFSASRLSIACKNSRSVSGVLVFKVSLIRSKLTAGERSTVRPVTSAYSSITCSSGWFSKRVRVGSSVRSPAGLSTRSVGARLASAPIAFVPVAAGPPGRTTTFAAGEAVAGVFGPTRGTALVAAPAGDLPAGGAGAGTCAHSTVATTVRRKIAKLVFMGVLDLGAACLLARSSGSSRPSSARPSVSSALRRVSPSGHGCGWWNCSRPARP